MTQAPPTSEQFDGAVDAVEAGEDPGQFDLREALASVANVVDPRRLLQNTARLGVESLKIAVGRSERQFPKQDWRFRDATWSENPFYRRLGQAYLAFCEAAEGTVEGNGGDWRVRERARFAVEIATTALAPTNMLLGNPEAMKRALETGGGSLVAGLRNWLHDIRHNRGMPSQVDLSEFEVGGNLAATPGAVVFRHELLEVLQYTPTTRNVYEIPVLIITPQINKYYFLDLAPGRSFVEFLVARGFRPFMVSWKNPSPQDGEWGIDAYCTALLEAIDAVREITGSDQVNAFGFCAGGITMSGLLGYLTHHGDDRINAISFAVTLLDFSQPALIGVLQARPLLDSAKERSQKKGILDGEQLAMLFSWFRPNDLVWNYWVNNYLLGRQPPAFDILAWNSDSTNLAGCLHGEFLDIFGRNSLTKPGELRVLGAPVDLGSVKNDAFVTGAVNDHLTPWVGCYQTTQLLGGECEFILSNAGHIASLVNPPGNPKASYLVGPTPGPDHEAWQAEATERQGSWWERWAEWAGERSGAKRRARKTLGSDQHPPLADAPGEYVFG